MAAAAAASAVNHREEERLNRLTLDAQGFHYRNLPVLNFVLVVVLGLNLTPNVV